jgi:hypothetical protein
MTDIFDTLSDKVHADIKYVQAKTLFWQEDTVGEICSVALAFADGTALELACAIPSGILVRHHQPGKGVPPGLEEETAVLPDVRGALRRATRSAAGMVLEIGKYQCKVENVGDQLAIHVDGEDISARIRPRQG